MKMLNLAQVVMLAFAFIFFPVHFAAIAASICGGITEAPAGCKVQFPMATSIENGTMCQYEPIECDQPKPSGGTCPCTTYNTIVYTCFCNGGYSWVYQSVTPCTCQPCPANTYSSGHNTKCLSCPANSTSPAKATTCRCTQPGYYFDIQKGECLRCPAGALDVSGNDVYGTTSSTGGYIITDCFLPANTNYYESLGRYIYSNICSYE